MRLAVTAVAAAAVVRGVARRKSRPWSGGAPVGRMAAETRSGDGS